MMDSMNSLKLKEKSKSRTEKLASELRSTTEDVKGLVQGNFGQSVNDSALESNVSPERLTQALAEKLEDEVEHQIAKGNLETALKTLNAQAFALNKVFLHLLNQDAKQSHIQKTYYELAFKAQNQCRKTLATMAEIARPKQSTFIAQMNHGHNIQVKNEK